MCQRGKETTKPEKEAFESKASESQAFESKAFESKASESQAPQYHHLTVNTQGGRAYQGFKNFIMSYIKELQ